MNNQSFSLAERLIPATYIQQASASIRARENLVKNLLEQVMLVKIFRCKCYSSVLFPI